MVAHINTRYEPTNKDIVATYYLTPPKGMTIYSACEVIASEAETASSPCTVFKVNRRESLICVAMPIELFEAGNVEQMIGTLLASEPHMARLILADLTLPERFATQSEGPRHGGGFLREKSGIQRRPMVAIQLPKGLTPAENAKLAWNAFAGMADIVMEHPQTHPRMLKEKNKALAPIMKKIGEEKLYIPHLCGNAYQIQKQLGECAKYQALSASELSTVSQIANKTQAVISRNRPTIQIGERAQAVLELLAGADCIRYRGEMPNWISDAKMPMQYVRAKPADVPAMLARCGESLMIIGDTNHPAGPQSAARALRQALEATMTNVPLMEYAKVHKELRASLMTPTL